MEKAKEKNIKPTSVANVTWNINDQYNEEIGLYKVEGSAQVLAADGVTTADRVSFDLDDLPAAVKGKVTSAVTAIRNWLEAEAIEV